MTPAWKQLKLHEVAEVFDGPHATPKTVDSGPIFLGISALQDGSINLRETRHVTEEDFARWTRRVKPQAEDVVFSYETRLGQVAIIPHGLECCLGRRMGLVRFRPGFVEPRFFTYQYLSPQFKDFLASKIIRGATVDRISIKDFPSFTICVPSVTEQRRIVAILDEAFERIATAKAHAERNLRSAREVRDTFLAAQFSPAPHWIAGPLSTFVESVSTGPFGSVLHKSDYVANGVPLINPINIVDGDIVPTDEKQVDAATALRLRSYLLRSGDIVVGRRGEIGRCAVVSDAQEGWLCGTGCFFIRPSSRVQPSFMAHLIRSARYRTRLEALSTGTTMQNLSNGALSGLEVVLPDRTEQKRLLAEIDAMSAQTDLLREVYERKLAALDELKQSLLHQAFSGTL